MCLDPYLVPCMRLPMHDDLDPGFMCGSFERLQLAKNPPLPSVQAPMQYMSTCQAPMQYISTCQAPMQYISTCQAPVQYISTCQAPMQYISTCQAPMQYISACQAPMKYINQYMSGPNAVHQYISGPPCSTHQPSRSRGCEPITFPHCTSRPPPPLYLTLQLPLPPTL